MFYAQRQALNRPLFQHVSACCTHTRVVLDAAWPWASEANGLCRLCVILLCAYAYTRKIIRPYRSRDRRFKHATKSIAALDTAWPWANANDTYGLCCLRTCFCAHKLIRARSYVVIPQTGIAMGFLLQIRFRKGVGAGAGVVVLGAGAVSARLRRLSAGKAHRCWCQLVVRGV